MPETSNYTEENIKSLDWREHIRLRPGMYIGKSGDGSSPDDGIYVLLKEVIDNCIDEFVMGEGKVIDITINDDYVSVRDYGRGIPLGKLVEVVSKMNGNNNSCNNILFSCHSDNNRYIYCAPKCYALLTYFSKVKIYLQIIG